MKSEVDELIYSNRYFALTREELKGQARIQMSAKRFKHVLGVEAAAVRLAEQYGASIEAASIAALCHDMAKEKPDQEMKELIKETGLPSEMIDYGSNVWHGPCAAEIVKREYHLFDEDILNAIRYHTVGRSEMSLLEQVIYVADYIEAGRQFPGVEEARRLADEDLEAAVSFGTQQTLAHLIQTKKKIYPRAVATYNRWVADK